MQDFLGVVDFGSVLRQPLNDFRDQVKRIPQLLMQRLDGLASAADNEIQQLLTKLQNAAQPIIASLEATAKSIDDYAASIKLRPQEQKSKHSENQVDFFPELWSQLQTFSRERGNSAAKPMP